MKVVINSCFGGFGLSEAAYAELGIEWDGYGYRFAEDRTNPQLVAVVEKLGKSANGINAKLKVVEIPEGIKWEIQEHAGREYVREESREWS